MSEDQERTVPHDEPTFTARALSDDGEELGRIEDVPFGNLVEFVGAHLTRTPWDPGQVANEIEIEQVGTLYE